VWGLPMAMQFMCMLFGFPFVFLYVVLKLKLYKMGVPKGSSDRRSIDYAIISMSCMF
jgi:hypothetical protein